MGRKMRSTIMEEHQLQEDMKEKQKDKEEMDQIIETAVFQHFENTHEVEVGDMHEMQ